MSGWFRGEIMDGDREVAQAVGSQNCPRSGFLLGLSGSNGKVFATEVTKGVANFSSTIFMDGKLWTVLAETDTTRIQKRNHQGYMEKEYAFPNLSLPRIFDKSHFIISQVLPINSATDDFLYFTGSIDTEPRSLTDTFYYQNNNSNTLSNVLMKRSGSLLKEKLSHGNVFTYFPEVENIIVFPNPIRSQSTELYVRALDGKFIYSGYKIFKITGQFLEAGTFEDDEAPLKIIPLKQHYAPGMYSLILLGQHPLTVKIVVTE
jgi:hypothetical protein